MKTLDKPLYDTSIETSKPSVLKSIIAGILMTTSILWATSTKAQDAPTTLPSDSTKTEKIEPPKKTWVFMLDPTYSPTDKVGTVRLSWGSSVHGVTIGWFLDLTWTPDVPTDVSSAFGKVTIWLPITKWIWLASELMLSSAGKDAIRFGADFKFSFKDWSGRIFILPTKDATLSPEIGIGWQKTLWAKKKTTISWFIRSDLKQKVFYSETEITQAISKHIALLLQSRVGGTYDTKPKAAVYVGTRIKF